MHQLLFESVEKAFQDTFNSEAIQQLSGRESIERKLVAGSPTLTREEHHAIVCARRS